MTELVHLLLEGGHAVAVDVTAMVREQLIEPEDDLSTYETCQLVQRLAHDEGSLLHHTGGNQSTGCVVFGRVVAAVYERKE